MLIPVDAIYVIGFEDEIHFVTECQLYTETRNKFLSEVGLSHNDCTKTMFVNLLTFKNEQLIPSLLNL